MIFKFQIYIFLSTQSLLTNINVLFIEVPIHQGTSKRAKVMKIIAMLGILIILATSVTSVAYLTIGNGKEEKGKLKTAEVV